MSAPAPLRLGRADTRRGSLILVNREHPLHSELVPDLVPLPGGWPDLHLDRDAARMLGAAIRAAGGAGQILPVSAWRSEAEQRSIWADTLMRRGPDFTARYVARPGCSEHQTGLAVDLALAADTIDAICPDFPNEGVCAAFRRLAPRYGFVERYTEAKRDLTGIAAEPWHFRYVGAPHALLLYREGLCLEEYPAFLDGGPRTLMLENGRRVRVSRLPCRAAVTELRPTGLCWQISGDNAGGFILTEWEV